MIVSQPTRAYFRYKFLRDLRSYPCQLKKTDVLRKCWELSIVQLHIRVRVCDLSLVWWLANVYDVRDLFAPCAVSLGSVGFLFVLRRSFGTFGQIITHITFIDLKTILVVTYHHFSALFSSIIRCSRSILFLVATCNCWRFKFECGCYGCR